MSDIFFIRHGPTNSKSMVGWSDIPADLSDTAKLARLSNRLPKSGVVISSDLKRAVDTADSLNLPQTRLPNDPGLREINFGDWELKTFKEIDESDHNLVFSFYDSPGSISAPNGESWDSFCLRVNAVMDGLILEYLNQPLVIVAHFGVILSQIQRAEGQGPKHTMRHEIDNLSITHLECNRDIWAVNKINFSA